MSSEENLELVKPSLEYGPEYLAMVEESLQSGEGYGHNNIELARADFALFVRELEEEAEGIGLPPGIPPQQTYFLLRDGKMVVGEIRFRPNVSPPYEKYSGHIGYNIRPSQRGKRYGTRQLALVLAEARKLGLAGVSLTIRDDNPGSVRVIEKNGGKRLRVIENPVSARVVITESGELQIVDVVRTGEKCDLYWIALH
ncbi:MAG TPA: GNAT family N-acetyltransferase [Ktedonobacteraceae bacterium]|jgi:predicted acetyltransferase|nr:GNAT family N-acetyltransferase [Ktedonobacteraceae bacterium]